MRSARGDRSLAWRWGASGGALLAALAVALLLLGAVHPGHLAVVQGMVAVALFLVASLPDEALSRGGSARGLVRALALMPLALLVGLVPLPPALLGWLAPGTAAAHPDQWWTLALAPWLVFEALSLWALLLGFTLGVGAWGAARRWSRDVADQALQGLLFALVLVAWVHALGGLQAVFGVVRPEQVPSPYYAPLVDTNHLGTLLLLLGPITTLRAAEGWRKRSDSWMLSAATALGALGTLIAIRAPGAYAGLGVMVVVGLWRWRGWRWGLAASGLMLGVARVAWWAWPRFVEEDWVRSAVGHRWDQWRDSPAVLAHYWFAGTGGGGYSEAYLPYSSARVYAHFTHVHSDWQEWVLQTGLLGVVALIGVLVLLPRASSHKVSRGSVALSLGLVGAFAHAIVDFPLQIPAIAMAVGAVLALRWTAFGRAQPTDPRGLRRLIRVVAVLVLFGGLWSARVQVVERQVRVAQSFSIAPDAALAAADQLARLAPWEPEVLLVRAWQAEVEGRPEDAALAAQEVIRRRPDDPKALRQAAMVLHRQGQETAAHAGLLRARARYPSDYRTLALLAEWVPREEGMARAEAWAEALRHWPYVGGGAPLLNAYRELPLGIWWVDALEDAPPWWSIFLGQELMREGDSELALLAFEQAVRGYGARTVTIPDYAVALARLGREDEAKAWLGSLFARGEDDLVAWVALARVSEELGEREPAVRAWMRAHQMMPSREIYALNAIRAAAAGSPEEGLALVERLRLAGGETPQVTLVAAGLERRRGSPGECVDRLRGLGATLVEVPGAEALLQQCLEECVGCQDAR
ncbi:MAG: O-antigen ligase family protein [Deltaproteobacteria bacterium]|nr:O-antigen ligase family protein [Deltaproteobacteria bacterium]